MVQKLRKIQEKGLHWGILLLLLCLYFLRIFMLEQDLAPWGVGYYQPADEGQYSLPVINDYNLGGEALAYPSYVPYHLRANFIGNTVTKWGMDTFGDNYFGFRLSSVLFGFLNLILLILNLETIRKKYAGERAKKAGIGILGIAAFLLIDFTFFNASIVVEPCIVRMLFAQILLLIVLHTEGHGRIRFFLLSFFSMLSIGLVYFTNLFFLLGCGLLLLLQWKKEGFKKFFRYGVWFVLGMAAAFGLAELYYTSVWGTHFFTNFFRAIISFSQSAGYEITGITNSAPILKSLIKAAAFYFSSNSFFYCMPLLAALLFFVPAIMVRIFQQKDELATFLFALPFSFLLQTLFSIDCITRKSVIIYPITICLVFYMFLVDQTQWQKSIPESLRKAYFILCACFQLLVTIFRLFIVSDGTTYDFTGKEKALILLVGLLPIIVFFVLWAFRRQLFAQGFGALKKRWIILGILPFLVSPVIFSHHFLVDRTYTERETMIEMGEAAGDGYVVGAYVSGFTLYNDIKPITAISEKIPIYMSENPALLYLDYEDKTPGLRDYFDNYIFKGSDYSAWPVYEGERAFQTFGQSRGIFLYTTKYKKDIVKSWKSAYARVLQQRKDAGYIDPEVIKNLSTEDALEYIKRVSKEQEACYKATQNAYDAYPDIYGDVYAVPETEDIYVNIYGDIYNSMYFDMYGDIYGDVRGDVYGTIHGNVYGTIYGNVYGEIKGTVSGGILGTEKEG